LRRNATDLTTWFYCELNGFAPALLTRWRDCGTQRIGHHYDEELGYQGIELDARLALAEIEMKTGQVATGRAHLAAIEVDAKAKG
jgi:hypothetical protein